MSRLLTTSILILLAFSINAQQLLTTSTLFDGTYDKAFIRKNKIKQISIDLFFANKNIGANLFLFDKKGFLQKITYLDSNRKKISISIITYNEKGDEIEHTDTDYEYNEISKGSYRKEYNGNLLILKETCGYDMVTRYIYNSKGQKIQDTTILGPDSSILVRVVSDYTYNTRGKLISIKETGLKNDGGINFIRLTSFVYDTNGNVISVSRSNAPTYFLSYDKKGLLKSNKMTMPEYLGGFTEVNSYRYSFWK